MSDQPQELSPAMKLVDQKNKIEKTISFIESIFGSNIWHDQQKIVNYLKGRLEGIDFAMKVMDL